jgi:hypothetical protein
MGCGGSSLKGDAPSEVGAAAPPQPVRKVQSNFKDIDYSTAADPRKSSTPGDRAPHEVDPPKAQKEGKHDDITAMAQKDEDMKLEPYKTITDSDQPAPLASSGETPDMIR